MEELITTLEEEYEIYRDLLPIAEQKTKAIIHNDLDALQSITAKEQFVVDKVTALENKREGVIVNISIVVNKDPSTLNIKAIVDMLAKQPEEQQRLKKVHENLKDTIQKLVGINNHNRALIEQSLEMIEFNLNFIQSTKMSPGSGNYTKGASQFDAPIPQKGMFDAKQ